jgi:hypothetical protein
MVFGPGIEVKAIKGDTLFADGNFGETRPNDGIEPIPIHAQVQWCVPQPDQPRKYRERRRIRGFHGNLLALS